jgi:hypothetical protein
MAVEPRKNAQGKITSYRGVCRRPGDRRKHYTPVVRTKPEALRLERELNARLLEESRRGPAPEPRSFGSYAADWLLTLGRGPEQAAYRSV